jgi:hypothetical protein
LDSVQCAGTYRRFDAMRAFRMAQESSTLLIRSIIDELLAAENRAGVCALLDLVSSEFCGSFWSGVYQIEECIAPDSAGSFGLATCGFAIHLSGAELEGQLSFRSGSAESNNLRRDFDVVFAQYPVCDSASTFVSASPSVFTTIRYPIRFNSLAYDFNARDSHLLFSVNTFDAEAPRIDGEFTGVFYYPSLSGQADSVVLKGTVKGSWSATPRSAFPKCTYPANAQICQSVSGTGYRAPEGEVGVCDWRFVQGEAREDEWLEIQPLP